MNEHYKINEPNIVQFFDYDLITSIFNDQNDEDSMSVDFLDEIFICAVSILIFKKDNYTVLRAIESAIKICEKF